MELNREVDDADKVQGDNQGAVLGVMKVVKKAFPEDMQKLSPITPVNTNFGEKEVNIVTTASVM